MSTSIPPRELPGDGATPGRVKIPPSLSEHVCQVLREDILAGRLAPGERLTEAAVIERTGASRTPVREGLRRLEAEGLVVSHRSRGTYITYRLSTDGAMVIYDLRLTLEPFLTKLAAARMSREELEAVAAVLARFSDATESNPTAAGPIDADFHLAIYEAASSELMSVVRGYWSRLQLELSERVYTAEDPGRFLREHEGIYEALASGDGELAARRMHQHIEHGRTALRRALEDGERGTAAAAADG